MYTRLKCTLSYFVFTQEQIEIFKACVKGADNIFPVPGCLIVVNIAAFAISHLNPVTLSPGGGIQRRVSVIHRRLYVDVLGAAWYCFLAAMSLSSGSCSIYETQM